MAAAYFFVGADGAQSGPVTPAQLKQALERRVLSEASLVWTQTMSAWTPLKVGALAACQAGLTHAPRRACACVCTRRTCPS